MKKFIKLAVVTALTGSLALAACGMRPEYDTEPLNTLAFPHDDARSVEDYAVSGYYDITHIPLSIQNNFSFISGTVTHITQRYQFIPRYETFVVSPDTPGETITVEGEFSVRLEREDGREVVFSIDNDSAMLVENLEIGMIVTGVYNQNVPTILIYPPHLHAVALVEGASVAVSRFDENFLSSCGTLVIHVTESTEIILQDGTQFNGDYSELVGRALVLLYNEVTDSFPVQARPYKIVVLFEMAEHPILDLTDEDLTEFNEINDFAGMGEVPAMPPLTIAGNENGYMGIVPPIAMLTPEDLHIFWVNMLNQENSNIIVNGNTYEMPMAYVNDAGFLMVPVANIAEALGYTVVGEADNKIIGRVGPLTIGEDSYFIGRMAPMQLGAAPEVSNGVLFVPLNFFGMMIDAEVFVMDGDVIINNTHYGEFEDIEIN